jgi:hypothetical protein
MIECFNALNISHLVNMEIEIVDEAIIDMLKHLFTF